jgi:hypothetical protein
VTANAILRTALCLMFFVTSREATPNPFIV